MKRVHIESSMKSCSQSSTNLLSSPIKKKKQDILEDIDSLFLSEESDDDNDDSNLEITNEYGQDGYMYIEFGHVFVNRYTAIRKLGWGHFSTVWLCWDMIEKRFIALKVLKSKANYTNLAFDEIKLLKILAKTDTNHKGYSHTIRFYDFFKSESFNGTHMCMVFEVCGKNLLSLIKDFSTKDEGFVVPIKLLKKLIYDLLEGLVYIHSVCGLIHTDIKPENIVVSMDQSDVMKIAQKCYYLHFKQELPLRYVSNISSRYLKEYKKWASNHRSEKSKSRLHDNIEDLPFALKNDQIIELQNYKIELLHKKYDGNSKNNSLSCNITQNHKKWYKNIFMFCDFGNACYVDKHFSEHIQTCEYQSPEVIVESGYNETADIWSLACTIFELATGDYLFDPKSGKNYSREEDHLSMIIELLGDSKIDSLKKGTKFKQYFNSKNELKHIRHPSQWKLSDVLIEKYGWMKNLAIDFSEFLLPMLEIDPKKRPTAQQCLTHSWLKF